LIKDASISLDTEGFFSKDNIDEADVFSSYLNHDNVKAHKAGVTLDELNFYLNNKYHHVFPKSPAQELKDLDKLSKYYKPTPGSRYDDGSIVSEVYNKIQRSLKLKKEPETPKIDEQSAVTPYNPDLYPTDSLESVTVQKADGSVTTFQKLSAKSVVFETDEELEREKKNEMAIFLKKQELRKKIQDEVLFHGRKPKRPSYSSVWPLLEFDLDAFLIKEQELPSFVNVLNKLREEQERRRLLQDYTESSDSDETKTDSAYIISAQADDAESERFHRVVGLAENRIERMRVKLARIEKTIKDSELKWNMAQNSNLLFSLATPVRSRFGLTQEQFLNKSRYHAARLSAKIDYCVAELNDFKDTVSANPRSSRGSPHISGFKNLQRRRTEILNQRSSSIRILESPEVILPDSDVQDSEVGRAADEAETLANRLMREQLSARSNDNPSVFRASNPKVSTNPKFLERRAKRRAYLTELLSKKQQAAGTTGQSNVPGSSNVAPEDPERAQRLRGLLREKFEETKEKFEEFKGGLGQDIYKFSNTEPDPDRASKRRQLLRDQLKKEARTARSSGPVADNKPSKVTTESAKVNTKEEELPHSNPTRKPTGSRGSMLSVSASNQDARSRTLDEMDIRISQLMSDRKNTRKN